MPAFNEEATIERAIERAQDAELGVETELLVVENGSTDRTREILTGRDWSENTRFMLLDRNVGKGGGFRAGLGDARGTYTAILDADLEYDPADLRELVAPLLAGEADASIGSRVFTSHSAYGYWYVRGGRSMSTMANMLYNAWLSDILSCLKVAPTELLRSLRLTEPGFAIDAEIAARLLRAGFKIYEVPISYNARSRAEGKKLTASDGFRVLRTLIRCRFDRWSPAR